MLNHILKLLWNRKGSNALVMLEVLMTFWVVFVVSTLAMYLLNNFRRPLGFVSDGIWHVYCEAEEDVNWPETSVRLLRELRAFDEVEEVSFSFSAPYDDETRQVAWTEGERTINVQLNEVSDEFRDVLSLDLVAGRWFEEADSALGWDPVVIDRDLARTLFGDEDPLGRIVELPGEAREQRVVGVLVDFREDGEFSDPGNYLFERKRMGHPEDPPVPTLLVKLAPGVTANFEEALVKRIQAVTRDWYFEVNTLDRLRRAIVTARLTPLIASAVVAVFLMIMVGLGLAGVMWQNVIWRQQELGLRRAVGASAARVRRQVVMELLILTVMALILGVVVGLQLPIGAFVDSAKPLDIAEGLVLAGVSILLLSLAAGFYPSWMATQIEPVDALRHE